MLIGVTLFGSCFNSVSMALERQQKREPLPIELALSLRRIGNSPLGLSPDGQLIAYTLVNPRRRESPKEAKYLYFTPTGVILDSPACDVWITNIKTGETLQISKGIGSSWGPVWSPDGKYLAFYSDQNGKAQLWIWEKATSRARQVSGAIVHPSDGEEVVHWTRDSRSIVVRLLPEGMTLDEAGSLVVGINKPVSRGQAGQSTAIVYKSSDDPSRGVAPQAAGFNRFLCDLAVMDVENGKVSRISRRDKIAGYKLSPDGKYVAYTRVLGLKEGTRDLLYLLRFDLIVQPVNGGNPTIVVSSMPHNDSNGFSWSPTKNLLSYTTADGECFLVPATGGSPRKITESKHPDFASSNSTPIWDQTGDTLYFAANDALYKVRLADGQLSEIAKVTGKAIRRIIADSRSISSSTDNGRSIVVATRDSDTLRDGILKIEISSGKAINLIEENKVYGRIVRLNDGRSFAYIAEDASHTQDIWLVDAESHQLRQLTNSNPELERYQLGKSRLVEWIGPDGQKLRGALLLPADYEEGKRYPMIVFGYGGSTLSGRVNRFGLSSGVEVDNMQMLATRGYAVLMTDSSARIGSPMRDIANTILPGVNKVIEMGIADPNRLGVMGQSYGGYSVLSLIEQTARFKAAICRAGLVNLISSYGFMREDGSSILINWAENGQGRMGGTPWEQRERYIENSPVFYLDRIQTPLLIIHGTLDDAVPISQTAELFVGLRRLGKEAVYVRYVGEWHSEAYWGYANMKDYCERMIAWFDEHLKQKIGD